MGMGSVRERERERERGRERLEDDDNPRGGLRQTGFTATSKGIIHLEDDLSGDESVDSDVVVVVQWDRSLRSTKTFKTAVLILSGRKYESPNLESLQKILHLFVNEPASDYFKKKSSQTTAFENIQAACKAGWKSETTRKKKWSVRFTAEHLAFLLVLQKQVKSEKEAQEANARFTRLSTGPTGVPKANKLKRAFRKLEMAYEKPFKLYVKDMIEQENVVHRTPSLSLQLTCARVQDHVPWASFPKSESNCPIPGCGHASTMPLQSLESINSGDDRLRRAAEANGGDGVFEPIQMKVGCYCFSQNCFGDESGIGCWRCVELACEKGDPVDDVEPGVCRFGCSICACSCQATFEESKRNQISNALRKNAEKGSNPIKSAESKREGGRSLYHDYVMNKLDNYSVREFQQVDFRSKDEMVQDVFTKASIDALHDSSLQCNPYVMRGLQGIIPGRRSNVEVTPNVAGGTKVSMSIAAARKELKGQQRKNPPKMPSLHNHTPPNSNFLGNAGNRAHRNGLSRVALDPCKESAVMVTGGYQTARSPQQMMDRVQKRVLDKFLDSATTPQTKRFAAKVHTQLAQNDGAFMTVVDRLQDIQSSQEISDACLALQRAMD